MSHSDHQIHAHKIARQMLIELLRCDLTAATDLVEASIRSGMPLQDLYLHIFQPCLYRVGFLWQQGRISVAQEHYISAAIQTLMARLYPQIFHGEKRPITLVAACVSGELHEIGIRMISDLFELAGWHTIYLGASVPSDQLPAALLHHSPDLIALSATLQEHIPHIRQIIQQIRQMHGPATPAILVGGQPFSRNPDLWQQIGADATAADAATAVSVGETLLVTRP